MTKDSSLSGKDPSAGSGERVRTAITGDAGQPEAAGPRVASGEARTAGAGPWPGCSSNDTGYHRPNADGKCSDCGARRTSNERAWDVLRKARLIRYEHGGGRFVVIDDQREHQQRELVADFYNEDTRELIFKLIQDAIGALETKAVQCVWRSGCRNHRICDEMGCCQQLGTAAAEEPSALPHGFVMVGQCASCLVQDLPGATHHSQCACSPGELVRPEKASAYPSDELSPTSGPAPSDKCEHGIPRQFCTEEPKHG